MANNLYSQVRTSARTGIHVIAIGEILWDVFDDSTRLGGAPLNFAVNVSRMGYRVSLISALGDDTPGISARQTVESFGLDSALVSTVVSYPTGTAQIELDPDGHTTFRIQRPAAYDAVDLSDDDLVCLANRTPQWLYFGTLFSSTDRGMKTLRRLIDTLPDATRFYDLNLRPETYSPDLVRELLDLANVVKLNESEMEAAGEFTGLPTTSTEAFCRAGAAVYGWKAVCVTMGQRGCAVLSDRSYAESPGYDVEVVDTVGAGDGCAAAFLYGITERWQPGDIGVLANRIGAMIVSSPGAIPDWKMSNMLAGVP